ncbi:MAG: amidohydrolase family protein [Armatimonadota bacterium]|nr:amidohydrolase family protein [Armatimonadota bacterium]
MRIDSHQHFWQYNQPEYGWISEEMSALRRDFLPADLHAELGAAGIAGVVSVQARQTLEETAWLLELAAANDFIKGVVGWVPLISSDVTADVERFAAAPKLKGVRHVLHDEADEHYLLRDDFNAGIRALRPFGLVYDILIFERHLPQTIEFVDRHPAQVFVLDHIAKPRIKEGRLEPWRTSIRELAKRENVCCKVSGMVTEADWQHWTPDGLRPYFEVVLEAFGCSRLMFGSDWPVCLVACGYARWAEVVHEWAAPLSGDEKNDLFGDTARRVYKLT